MKKYFVFAAAALTALASCSKVEVDPTAQNGPELTFKVANYMASTKAGTTATAAFDTDETFGTFAIYTQSDYTNAGAGTVFMNNQEISFQAPDWKAKGVTYYWPKTGKLSFVSYAPYISGTGAPTFTYDSQSQKDVLAINGYTVEKSIESQVAKAASFDANDLMYSTLRKNQQSNEDKHYGDFSTGADGVATLFHHMLSKVNVKVGVKEVDESSAYRYGAVVKSIAVNGIYVTGDYKNTVLDGSIGTWTPTGSVIGTAENLYLDNTTSFENNAAFTYSASGSKALYNGVAAKDFVSNYYVLPQTFSDETAKLVITYDFYTLNKEDDTVISKESITETKYTTVALKNMMAGATRKDAWVENTIMTYTVTIAPGGEIHFDPAQTAFVSDSASYQITLGE